MKKLIALLTVLVLSVSIVGCGQAGTNDGDQGNQGTPGTGDEKVTIRMSWWGGESRHNATLDVINMFMEEYPNITVLPEYTAWDGHYEKITTQLIGGTEADLMQINFNWFFNFSPDGQGFYDLTKLNNLTLENWPAESYEAITMNGIVQGVPTSVSGRLFYLNKTIFDQAGVEIPETWEDYLAAGRTFRDTLGNDYYPLGNLSYTDSMSLLFFNYVTQLTGKPIIGEDNKLSYTQEELEQGFAFLTEMMENHVFPTTHVDSANKDEKNPRWIDGRYAGLFEWDSAINKYLAALDPSKNFEIVLAPYPTQPGQQATGAYSKIAMAWAISKNSKAPEAAARLLEFMYTNEEAVLRMGLERAVPVNTVARAILEDNGVLTGLAYEGHLLVNATETFSYHPFYEDAEVKEAYIPIIEEYARGEMTPTQAAQRILSGFNNAVNSAINR